MARVAQSAPKSGLSLSAQILKHVSNQNARSATEERMQRKTLVPGRSRKRSFAGTSAFPFVVFAQMREVFFHLNLQIGEG